MKNLEDKHRIISLPVVTRSNTTGIDPQKFEDLVAEMIELLNEGWEIISAVGTGNAAAQVVTYVLRKGQS